MFDGLSYLGGSISKFAAPAYLGLILLSSFAGLVIGALPGLTATMGIALLTTLTLKMPPDSAILVLICTYVGAIYGGSRSAILLNIPGTPASAASCLDGYALARQGRRVTVVEPEPHPPQIRIVETTLFVGQLFSVVRRLH